jgi:hypothetical protein
MPTDKNPDHAPHRLQRAARGIGLGGVMLLGLCHAAMAGGDARPATTVAMPKYTQECAACHVAYPPGLLPAPSWQRLMNTLPEHFGTDASLDPATTQALSTWLTANAGTYKRVSEQPPQDRITRSAWFVRKHDEVGAEVWKRPTVKSPSNCVACHGRAEQGDFNEHDVRIPR